jgi:hypothetical protein
MTSKKVSAPKIETKSEPEPRPQLTKRLQLIALLERANGATLADMTALTGWLPHTARATLTGLRKTGHVIASEKSEGIRRYLIEVAPAVKL